MRIATDADWDNEAQDYGQCPFCKAIIFDLATDVCDLDYQTDAKDVNAAHCPSCGKQFAIVREHSYRIAKIAAPKETTP